ncbi:hypothetical protein PC123_g22841 [Phytophthora cactorum]|nr:hypothetical protein PC123_g22831 [Phytophthora cactorum]KAG4041654.1 hypothetical protein PC123_g22841 [Phytophthora cactorum]
MLRTLSPTEQHGVALGFIVKEQRDPAAATTPRVQSLKLHVSNYVRKVGEPLLQWLVEVDTAIAARRIFDDPSKVAFVQQGKHDVHAYAQRARYLVSSIVTNPMDEATKVVTFMKGLGDGPVKTYLFRELNCL